MFYFGYAIESGLGNPVEVELSKKLMKLWGEFGNTGVPSLSAIDENFDWINFNPGEHINNVLDAVLAGL